MSSEMLILGGIGLFVLFVLGWIMAGFYQKCGPNEAMIVSGFGASESDRKFKIVVGGGAVVMPVIQQRAFLSLEVMPIEVRSAAPIITKSKIPIFVEGVAQVKVKGDDVSIATAAEQFLGKTDEEIANIAHETLVGHLRAMLGTMEVEDLIESFEGFAHRAQEISQVDLAKMGLTVVSFTIKEIKDNVGYLEALGKKRSAEAQRDAAIGAANSKKETEIAQAQATRDSQIAQAKYAEEGQKAQILANTAIAEAQKNFQISQAQYQAELNAKKAASDMTYDIVKAQTQQKLVEETQQIKIVEAQKQVELQTVQVQQKQVELEAEITKPAEAEQTRVRLMAQAEQQKRMLLAQADAEAAKLKAQGEAEATKTKALADAEATKALGQAQAASQQAQGLAQASIIAAKGEAEAEAMAKKAEAFKLYNDAAMASMVIERLPEIVAAAASPLTKVGSMTVLSTNGEGGGASKITGDILNVAAQGLTMVKGLTGIDLANHLRSDRKIFEDATK